MFNDRVIYVPKGPKEDQRRTKGRPKEDQRKTSEGTPKEDQRGPKRIKEDQKDQRKTKEGQFFKITCV